MSQNAGKQPPGGQPQREMTYLESDDEIRQAIQARQAAKPKTGKAQDPAIDDAVRRERPQERPPLGLLCILDDGKADGDWVRLRSERCVIGRTEGDVRVVHDSMMSSRHAEIVRERTASSFRWHLKDLSSTNGTYVRVGSTVLMDQAEILVGRGRYRLETGIGQATTTDAPDLLKGGTVGWADESARSLIPTLVEIAPGGAGQRFTLSQTEYWIGRDPKSCSIVRPDDVLVNARHARLYRDAKGLWRIENNKTVNGLWLRVDQIPLSGSCQFRLGEQRFIFRAV
jgi:pSer/pThr/pTyr-binding forkhead associated (FHA) protein